MIGLMRANFARLFKSKALWVCMIFSPALEMLSLLLEISGNIPFRRTQVPLEPNLFGHEANIILLLAIFAGLFLGTEYSDGGLRNKLIVGHTRTAVCLSDLLTCITAGLMIFAVQFSVDLMLGLAREYRQTVPTEEIVSRILICIGAILALSALFTLLGILVSGKSSSVTAAICLALAMTVGSSLILTGLAEPEYLAPLTIAYPDEIDENGEPRVETITEKNPDYVGGALRQTFETLNDLLPSGQLLQMGTSEVTFAENGEPTGRDVGSFTECAAPMIGYSLGIVLLATVGGISIFRKKNIK